MSGAAEEENPMITRPVTRPLAAATLAVAATAVVLLAPACATNLATGQRQLSLIGEQQEIAMGREADQQIAAQLGLYPDDELQAYVDRVGKELAAASERPDLPWTFRVVDDPAVNAFALPGGFIYLTRGILGHFDNEAQMASVLGHEIGHVTGRHSVEQISKGQLAQIGLGVGAILSPEVADYANLAQTGLQLLFLKYGRDAEREADSLGLRYLGRGGFAVGEMGEVFTLLDRVSAAAGAGAGRVPNWLSTHPAPANRRETITAEIAQAGLPAGGTVQADRYLAAIDGIVFGDDPRQGFFEGNAFYHPEMAFQLRFPDGWQTQNTRQAVAALAPNKDAVVVLTLDQASSPAAAANAFFGQQGLRRGNALSGGFGGLSGEGSFFVADRTQGEDLVGVASFVSHDGRVFRLLGYTAESDFRGYQGALQAAATSLRRLTDRSKLNVQPRRLEIVRLPSAMTLQEFARRYPSTVELQTLALINQVEPGATLPAGARVKRVVGGP
jgi:predicted Zn-dependent protease